MSIFQSLTNWSTSSVAQQAVEQYAAGHHVRSTVFSADLKLTTSDSRCSYKLRAGPAFIECSQAHLEAVPLAMRHFGLSGRPVCWEEQLLVYPVGPGVPQHIDQMAHGQVVAPRRHLTTLLYLNGAADYDGGEIEFPLQKIKIKPEPGLLLAFPGTIDYPHRVHSITRGVRLVYTKSWELII